MSLGYSISTHLLLPYTKENIELILKKGVQSLELCYYEIDYAKIDALGLQINANDALELINRGYPDKTMHCIMVKYQTTYFFCILSLKIIIYYLCFQVFLIH